MSGMNLYELNEELRNVEALMTRDEEAGLPQDEILTAALDQIKGQLSTKVLNIGAWVKSLDAEAEALKAEETRLALRRKVKEHLQDRLKAWVLQNIQAGAKFEDSRVAVGTRKSTRVEVIDQAALPSEYIRTKVIQEVAKDEIGKALKAGKSVAGARLAENINLTLK